MRNSIGELSQAVGRIDQRIGDLAGSFSSTAASIASSLAEAVAQIRKDVDRGLSLASRSAVKAPQASPSIPAAAARPSASHAHGIEPAAGTLAVSLGRGPIGAIRPQQVQQKPGPAGGAAAALGPRPCSAPGPAGASGRSAAAMLGDRADAASLQTEAGAPGAINDVDAAGFGHAAGACGMIHGRSSAGSESTAASHDLAAALEPAPPPAAAAGCERAADAQPRALLSTAPAPAPSSCESSRTARISISKRRFPGRTWRRGSTLQSLQLPSRLLLRHCQSSAWEGPARNIPT